jgi:hypothetical protein
MVRLHETSYIMAPGWQSAKTVSLWALPLGTASNCDFNAVAMCDNIFGDRSRWWGIARGVLNGQDRIWIFNADGSPLSFVDYVGIPYTVGEWVHIAIVHENGLLHIYKNGVEVAVLISGTTLQPNTGALPVLYLGGITTGATRVWMFEGLIDAVKIWNYAFSPTEVQLDMLQVLSGSEPGLAAYYRMSNGSGSILSDDSIYSWDGTLLDGMGAVPPNGSLPVWVPPGID